MPFNYSRKIAGHRRTKTANRQLGFILSFIAGGINAGGFLAVQQYTSHMTGIVSSMADHIALGQYSLVLNGMGALLCFVLGAGCAAVMVSYAQRHQLHSEYALPLLLEAGLLLCFGLLGAKLTNINGIFVSLTVMLLCFIMGLQNALMSKLSNGKIRTTHITGMVTDIGMELGKLCCWPRDVAASRAMHKTHWSRLQLLTTLLSCFFMGGIAGAIGFKLLGYVATVPLALLLMLLVLVPIVDDVSALAQPHRRRVP